MLPCQATGDPQPAIRWYKNGRPILGIDPRNTILDSGTLQISGNFFVILNYKTDTGPKGTVAKSFANGLVGTGFTSWYQLQILSGFLKAQ